MSDDERELAPIEAHWLQTTGAGDDVLEVTIRATSAQVRGLDDAAIARTFGLAAPAVAERVRLYRLAHEPGLAQSSEAEARKRWRG